jgi:hypothetical protein
MVLELNVRRKNFPLYFYLMSKILYSANPEFDFTFIVDHFFFPINAFQTGDSFEICIGSDKTSDSVEPTTRKLDSSPVSISLIVTLSPILTFDASLLLSSIISIFFNCSSKSEILTST